MVPGKGGGGGGGRENVLKLKDGADWFWEFRTAACVGEGYAQDCYVRFIRSGEGKGKGGFFFIYAKGRVVWDARFTTYEWDTISFFSSVLAGALCGCLWGVTTITLYSNIWPTHGRPGRLLLLRCDFPGGRRSAADGAPWVHFGPWWRSWRIGNHKPEEVRYFDVHLQSNQ